MTERNLEEEAKKAGAVLEREYNKVLAKHGAELDEALAKVKSGLIEATKLCKKYGLFFTLDLGTHYIAFSPQDREVYKKMAKVHKDEELADSIDFEDEIYDFLDRHDAVISNDYDGNGPLVFRDWNGSYC